MRVILVWLYNKTGKSVSATILYHTSDNVSWTAFPNTSSHYDPMVTGLLNALVVGILFLGRGATASVRRTRG
jgi:hypothetical protein